MGRADVGFEDFGILRDLRIRSLGEHRPALEDRDGVGEVLDDAEVVLDHQNRPVRGNLLDEIGHPAHVLVSHPLRGLVEQHELGLERERRRDLQGALAAVGQLDGDRLGERAEVDRSEQFERALVERVEAFLRPPEVELGAELALQRDPDVLEHGEVREHRRDLKRADNAAPRDLRRPLGGDVVPVIDDPALGRREELGEEIEDRGLASAVRSDQSVDASSSDLQVDVAYGDEALELLGEVAGFEDVIGAHAAGRASLARATADETPRAVARSTVRKGRILRANGAALAPGQRKDRLGETPQRALDRSGKGWEEERTSRSADAAQRAGTRSRRSSSRRAGKPCQIRIRLRRSSSRIRRSTSARLSACARKASSWLRRARSSCVASHLQMRRAYRATMAARSTRAPASIFFTSDGTLRCTNSGVLSSRCPVVFAGAGPARIMLSPSYSGVASFMRITPYAYDLKYLSRRICTRYRGAIENTNRMFG